MRKISRASEQFSEINFRTAGAWPSDEHYEEHIDELEHLRHDTEKGVDWHTDKGEQGEADKHEQLAEDLTRAIQDARALEGNPRGPVNYNNIRDKGFDAGPDTDRGGHVKILPAEHSQNMLCRFCEDPSCEGNCVDAYRMAASEAQKTNKYNYYEYPDAPTRAMNSPECKRCGINIKPGASVRKRKNWGRLCNDCDDVLSARPSDYEMED